MTCRYLCELDCVVSADWGGCGGSIWRLADFFQSVVISLMIEFSLSLQVERDFEREYGKLQQ